jgi:hypothetical protein
MNQTTAAKAGEKAPPGSRVLKANQHKPPLHAWRDVSGMCLASLFFRAQM